MKQTLPAVLAAVLVTGIQGQSQGQSEQPDCGNSVRKPWETLSCEERNAYMKGIIMLKEEGTYDDFASMHFNNKDTSHGIEAFLPWHRWFLWTFEKNLQRVTNSCITLPYWAWEQDYGELIEVEKPWLAQGRYSCELFSFPENQQYCGSTEFSGFDGLTAAQACCGCNQGGGKVVDGVCHDLTHTAWDYEHAPNPAVFHPNYFGSIDSHGTAACVSDGFAAGKWNPRDPYFKPQHGQCLVRGFENRAPSFTEADVLDLIMSNDNYDDFRSRLEGPHGAIHVWVGGIMASHHSPDDPLFFLNHVNVDRIWALWQDYHDHDKVGEEDLTEVHYSGQTEKIGPLVYNGIDDQMVFNTEGYNLDFNYYVGGKSRGTPSARQMHTLYSGLTSVTYAEDQLVMDIADEYNPNPNWLSPPVYESNPPADGSCMTRDQQLKKSEEHARKIAQEKEKREQEALIAAKKEAEEKEKREREALAKKADNMAKARIAAKKEAEEKEEREREALAKKADDMAKARIAANKAKRQAEAEAAAAAEAAEAAGKPVQGSFAAREEKRMKQRMQHARHVKERQEARKEARKQARRIAAQEARRIAAQEARKEAQEARRKAAQEARREARRVAQSGRQRRSEEQGIDEFVPYDDKALETAGGAHWKSAFLVSAWNEMRRTAGPDLTKKEFLHKMHIEKCKNYGNDIGGLPMYWIKMNHLEHKMSSLLCDPTKEVQDVGSFSDELDQSLTIDAQKLMDIKLLAVP